MTDRIVGQAYGVLKAAQAQALVDGFQAMRAPRRADLLEGHRVEG
jgi:hypothetical protein